MGHPSDAPHISLQLVYDLFAQPTPRLTICRLDERTERWYRKNEPAIVLLMEGLRRESPHMTDALLEEIAKRLAYLAKETGVKGPVHVRHGMGRILHQDPGFVAGLARQGLQQLLDNETNHRS